jgi:hypothetical protein
MSQIKQESVTGENDDILSIAGVSEWTLDTSNSSYINENAGPNESSSKITLLEVTNFYFWAKRYNRARSYYSAEN